MSTDRDRAQEDLAAYALGVLDPGERQRVEARLRTSADVEDRRLLGEYLAIRDLLPFALAPQPAPPAARARLMARVQGIRAVAEEESPAETPGRRWLRGGLAPFWLVRGRTVSPPSDAPRRGRPTSQQALRWAAATLALCAAVTWNVALQVQLTATPPPDIDARARSTEGPGIALVGTGVPTAAARLYVAADSQSAELAVTGLPPLRAERTYQVWFARPGQPTETGGAFRVDNAGRALVQVLVPVPLEEVSAIAVTEEPMPASPRPTGPHLLDFS